MNRKVFLHLMFALFLAVFVSTACTTTKNTGTAIKEGTTEAAQEVGDKAEDAGEKIEDGSITAAVKMKFANDEVVSASNIDVDTSHGNVTLNGTAKSQTEVDRAVQLAQSVDGVKSVHSNLVVR